ncbi:MAG: helix-turn-helix domain-containing protein [Minisyncoccia bacterium]|jgi:hypothetical protein
MVPRKFLVDHALTPQEKSLWITLAGFQYKATSEIFPGRERIAALLGVKDVNYISKMTRRLQEKGSLEKFHNKNKRVYYRLYYRVNIDEDDALWHRSFDDDLLKPNPNNPFTKPKNDND